MWNYAYFVINLEEQDKDDDDGIELYVRHCISREDVEWFPKNKAMCLMVEGAKTEGEQIGDMVCWGGMEEELRGFFFVCLIVLTSLLARLFPQLSLVEKKIEESEASINAYHEKRTEKLQRTIEHLGRSQRDMHAKLEGVAELLKTQAKAFSRVSGSLDCL